MDDHTRLPVRADLEPLDLDAIEHPSVAEPVAVGIRHELVGLGQGGFIAARHVAHRRPEPVRQLDRVHPEPTHLARYMVPHVREAATLAADEIGAVARGDVGPRLALDVLGDAVQGALSGKGRGLGQGEGQSEEDGADRDAHACKVAGRYPSVILRSG